jgi:hypothetical protein
MAYKRKAKKKEDLRKNPDKIDTSMGRYYLKMGRVVVLENRFYDNSNYHLFKR